MMDESNYGKLYDFNGAETKKEEDSNKNNSSTLTANVEQHETNNNKASIRKGLDESIRDQKEIPLLIPDPLDPDCDRTDITKSVRRKSRRTKWFRRSTSRLKQVFSLSYRNYDTFSVPSRMQSEINELSEHQNVVLYQTKDVKQDTSFKPTLGVTLFLGIHGLLVFVLVEILILGSYWHKLLLLGFLVVSFSQPRDEGSIVAMGLFRMAMLGVLITAIVYIPSITIAIMSISMIHPLDIQKERGKKLGEWIMIQVEKYFGFKTTIEDEDAIAEISMKGDACIFAFAPHDLIAYGASIFHYRLQRLPPGRVRDTMECLVSSAILNSPIMRQIFTWNTCAPVSKSYFRKKLQNKESFVFVPGGAQEVFYMDKTKPNKLVLYLKERKGFIKLALETGTPICPVFCFGLDGSYAYLIPKGSIMEKITSLVGFVPMIFFGRWGVPFGIPRPQKIHVVIGKPIYVPCRGTDIQEEDVKFYHDLYLTELRNLFERHKIAEEDYRLREIKII